jgi:hypothetical protein
MNDDPIVASVRAVREELAAAFGYDVHAIFADLRRQEAELGDRLVKPSSVQRPNQAAHSGGDSGCLPLGVHTTAAG